MDLLDRVGQEIGDENAPHRMGMFEPQRGKAETMLLARLSASLMSAHAPQHPRGETRAARCRRGFMAKLHAADVKMTRPAISIVAALLLGLSALCVARVAVAESPDTTQVTQVGQSKQFGTVKVTLQSYSIQGVNLADAETSISFLLFFEARSDAGELGDYNYAKTNCDGTIPPKGTFTCKLALVFPAAPKLVSLRVGEGMMGDGVYFNLPAASQ